MQLNHHFYLITLCIPSTVYRFVPRHNSTTPAELSAMVSEIGFGSLEELIDATVPKAIRRKDGMDLGKYNEGMNESEFLEFFK